MREPIVYARLPRAGLGNKLLVWARALVFARLNGLELFASNWSELKIGPFLRNEKSKRQYWGYFNGRYSPKLFRKLSILASPDKVYEPEIKVLPAGGIRPAVYLFHKTPLYDYFRDIRSHRDLVKDALHATISERYLALAQTMPPPVIGVHVRRSDFREPQPGELLGSKHNLRTPLEYYADAIHKVRCLHGRDLPATVFTDGRPEEIGPLLALPNTTLAPQNPDIVDLLLLARSKCIIVAAGSTFSYWAGFLADAPIVLHPLHPINIRPSSVNTRFFEGPLQADPGSIQLLTGNLRAIAAQELP